MTANICLQLEDVCSPIQGTIRDTYSNTLLHQEAELKPCCYDNFSQFPKKLEGRDRKIENKRNHKTKKVTFRHYLRPIFLYNYNDLLREVERNFFSREDYILLTNRLFSLIDFRILFSQLIQIM